MPAKKKTKKKATRTKRANTRKKTPRSSKTRASKKRSALRKGKTTSARKAASKKSKTKKATAKKTSTKKTRKEATAKKKITKKKADTNFSADGEVSYIDAIRLALYEEMKADKSVFLIGEDVAGFGGAFKASRGLLETFGEERIINTPIGESAIIGLATGAALQGMRPVAEMQFADFVTNGYTNLTIQAAKTHYRWGQPVPLVVRLPVGGGIGAGPFHSCNPEAWFANVPGLKIVAPSTPNDARGLLKASIRDNNPVLFLEHKFLYRRQKEELASDNTVVPLGRGRIARSGRDVTIITYHAMVHAALDAAESLAEEGIEVEVIDLRSLIPWDEDLVAASIAKTNRAIVVYEANKTGGFGAEIAATLAERHFQQLDAPIQRVASIDSPVPYAPTLEEFFMPNAGKIAEAVRKTANF